MNDPPRQLPLLVERDHLHQRHADAVGQAAVHLALDDHRVDPGAAVVDGDEARTFTCPVPGSTSTTQM